MHHRGGSKRWQVAFACGAIATAVTIAYEPTASAQRRGRAASSATAQAQASDAESTARAVNAGVDAALAIDPHGLTANVVGERARATSFTAKAQEQALQAAAARVDEAVMAFVPRVTGRASYTRLSDFTPKSLLDGQNNHIVATQHTTVPLSAVAFYTLPNSALTFPTIVDNASLSATMVVPITDYFLRIAQNYTAATNLEDAARYDAAAAGAVAEANGKSAFYAWVRAKGAVRVAEQALASQKAHLEDAKNLLGYGASKGDVLRAETGVASASLFVEHARDLELIAAHQVNLAIHADDDAPVTSAEDVTTPAPMIKGTLADARAEAKANRPELLSMAANVDALKQLAQVARAAYFPTIAGVADAIYANPNPRRIPADGDWFPTWDVGVQAVWSPNDAIAAVAGTTEADAKVAAAEAQRQAAVDGVVTELTNAWYAAREADFAVASTAPALANALEADRVTRELFNAGHATSSARSDAETELVRARLDALNAHVDAKTARIRLDHALGRDAKGKIDKSSNGESDG